MRIRLTCGRLLVVSFSCLVANPRTAHPQTLDAVAKKTAEERKGQPDATKVYTNADLKRTPESLPTPADAEPVAVDMMPVAPMTEAVRESLVSSVVPAVVTIEQGRVVGTGFFVAPGVVLTNRHVVDGASLVRVKLSGGRSSSASVMSLASDADLALVRVENPPSPQPTLSLGDARNAQVGQDVLVIGSALGLQGTVTRGIVSALRTVNGVRLVQTDAAINPGNSGGPLVLSNGQVVGITTMKVRAAEALGFAIGIEHAKTLIAGRTTVAMSGAKSTDDGNALNLPTRSAADAARDRDMLKFETMVREAARRADTIDRFWKQYRSGCPGAPARPVADGREWFGIWASTKEVDTAPRCQAQRADLFKAAAQVRDVMKQAEETARVAGLTPGTVRDIRRKYSMDWSNWDR
jgi:S1-C subfamily serine protease